MWNCVPRGNKALTAERCADEVQKNKKKKIGEDVAHSRGQSLCGVPKCLTQVFVFSDSGFRTGGVALMSL